MTKRPRIIPMLRMGLSASISSRAERERVIATARVALAPASVFAVWMDPAEPARYAETVYPLHSSTSFTPSPSPPSCGRTRPGGSRPARGSRSRRTSATSSSSRCCGYLTLGPSSPFFLLFQFSLFCAALRWGWEGTLYTAAVTVVTYMAMAASMIGSLGPGEFELDRFIIRAVYLRRVGRHSRVSRTPRSAAPRRNRTPRALAGRLRRRRRHHPRTGHGARGEHRRRGARGGGVGRGEEPTVRVASWSPSGAYAAAHAPSVFYPLLPEALETRTIICAGPVSDVRRSSS